MMRNADGQGRSPATLLTAERLRAAKGKLADSRNLALACRTIGDTRNFVQAARDFASAKRVASGLRKGAAA